SGIIDPGKLSAFIPPKAQPKSADELARELIRQNHLTKFQAQQVVAGKAKALILGNYTIIDKIGAGGMGQVYKAEHRRMKRLVAIKMLPSAMVKDAAALARFQREVEAAAKLRHPNIVAADDADESAGVHFLVMEYVDGRDLSATVKSDGPLSVAKAIDYILQAARGLVFAHGKGVVHRDIKPANLLVDAEGTVKILDMGLARIDQPGGESSELTGTGAVMGTVDYMAPEQALNTKHADHRADIYSIGISLYYLLAGKCAYGGDTVMEKLLAHREEPIPSLQAVQPNVPDALEAIYTKLVAKKIADRYQSMAEVVKDLEACQASLSTLASSAPLAWKTPPVDAGPSDLSIMMGNQNLRSIDMPEIVITPAKKTKPAKAAATAKASATGTGSSGAKGPPWKNKMMLLGAGGAAFFALLLGVIVVIRNPKGEVVARLEAPTGSTVEVEGEKPQLTREEQMMLDNANSPFKIDGADSDKTMAPASSTTAAPPAAKSTTEPYIRWPFDPADGREYTWSEPANLGPEVNTEARENTSGISADELKLYFTRNDKGLWASRSAVDQPFGKAQEVKRFGAVQEAAVSTDELSAVIERNDKKDAEFWLTTRLDKNAQFEAPVRGTAPLNDEGGFLHPALSPDGLTLLANSRRKQSQTGDIWMFTRAKIDQPFTTDERLAAPVSTPDWDMPYFISNDRLFVIASSQKDSEESTGKKTTTRQVRYFTRSQATEPFGPGLPLGIPLGDAEGSAHNSGFRLSADGRAIYFGSDLLPGGHGNHDIYVARRVLKSPSTLPPSSSAAVTLADLARGLVGHWNFEEGKGDVAADSSGNKNDGKLEGLDAAKAWQSDAPPSPLAGRTSLAFDGNGGVRVPDAPSLNPTAAITIALWCKPAKDVKYGYSRLIDKNSGQAFNFRLDEESDKTIKMVLQLQGVGDALAKPSVPIERDQWAHLVARYDGKQQIIYINGAKKSIRDASGPIGVSKDSLGIGKESKNNDKRFAFTGRLDDVRLYDRALTDAEIAVLAGQMPLAAPPAPSSVVYLDDLPEKSWIGSNRLGKHGHDHHSKPLLWQGTKLTHALFTHPAAEGESATVDYDLAKRFDRFEAQVGLMVPPSKPLTFSVSGDGKTLWTSSPLSEPQKVLDTINVDVRGMQTLRLSVRGGFSLSHAVWLDPRLTPAGSPTGAPTPIGILTSDDFEWSAPESLGPVVNATKHTKMPTLSDDQLCLIIRRDGNPGDAQNGLYELRRPTVDGPWGEPVQVTDGGQGNPSLSGDGLMLFTMNEWAKTAAGKSNQDLTVRTRPTRDAPWGKPMPLASLNTEGVENHPVISPDGLSLVFSSNRAGGRGQADLWISRRADLKADWQPPVRLGNKVNSSDYDCASQILTDGKTILVIIRWGLYLAAPDAQGDYDLRPVPLPPNVKIQQCWLSPDGATLYFDNAKAIENEEGANEIRLIRRVPKKQSADAAPPIPAEALTFNGHRYLLVDSPGTWDEARAKAEAMGGHLVTITTKEERDWAFVNLWKKKPITAPTAGAYPRIFLGARRGATSTDPWSWVTGEPVDMSLWLGKGPDGSGDAATWYQDGEWDDVPANSQKIQFFVVEWDTLGPAVASPSTSGPAVEASIDLLALVDVKRDAVAGSWTKSPAGLSVPSQLNSSTAGKGNPRLQLPYSPAEEYDLLLEFTPTAGQNDVGCLLAAQGREFWLRIDRRPTGKDEWHCGFGWIDGERIEESPESVKTAKQPLLKNDQRYQLTIEVRRTGLQAVLDGQPLAAWTGDWQRLSIGDSFEKLPERQRLGLIAYGRGVTFHKITVREVTGHGTLTAATAAVDSAASSADTRGPRSSTSR
ncbi:MAG TPA: protein kinase, partial [Pirellulales bacterium]|nr:protein kinase [Pirellulales bacterium]